MRAGSSTSTGRTNDSARGSKGEALINARTLGEVNGTLCNDMMLYVSLFLYRNLNKNTAQEIIYSTKCLTLQTEKEL